MFWGAGADAGGIEEGTGVPAGVTAGVGPPAAVCTTGLRTGAGVTIAGATVAGLEGVGAGIGVLGIGGGSKTASLTTCIVASNE